MGKSVSAVARIRDRYDNDCVRIFLRDVLKITCEVKSYDRRNRIAKIKYNGNRLLIRIPSDYKLHSPMHIFTNFHLFGIPYVFCQSFETILRWLKDGTISDGILAIDEAYLGINARECMSALGREMEKQSFQYRKMQLEVMIITPMARLIDWTARVIPTERILCSYNEKTREVTLTIKKKGVKGSREVTYDSTPYRANYWTNERITA
jgi:hypothetical protein